MTYRSAHHALICVFVDHARPGHSGWQDQFQPRAARLAQADAILRDPDEPPASLFRSTLHGMEEIAGEAAIVWRHLLRLGDTRAAALILRCCPPTLPRSSYSAPILPHPAYEAAMKWMVDESAGAVSGLSNYRARRDAIKMATGGAINIGVTADKCEVDRRTVSRLVQAIKAWERAIEEQAWRDIEDRLEAAGLIERERAA
ncbi:MAG: hypothetical protein KGL39_42065 [Patescibacteria group bacterium]|nr:hypothetical protein [Patescibacteria group bacterium]